MTDNEELAQLEELDETLQNAERDKLNAKHQVIFTDLNCISIKLLS